MDYTYPHIIENCVGEKLIFQGVKSDENGEIIFAESFCTPGAGPAMHSHLKQEESLTVLSGKMGYQIFGQQPEMANVGETILFKRGTAHKFWADGGEPLHTSGWIQPANSIEFYLSSVFAAQNKSGKGRPETFDAAYLLTRYASEYNMPEIPTFVKKVILPITYFIGRLMGKYKHFEGAPIPMK